MSIKAHKIPIVMPSFIQGKGKIRYKKEILTLYITGNSR